jgi:hypothetical protein
MERLCERFPAAFNALRPKPLKLYIDKDLLPSAGLNQDEINKGLACYRPSSRKRVKTSTRLSM